MSARRFTDKPQLAPEDVRGLPPDHPAMRESRTLFPSAVVTVTASEPDRLLVSGRNNRKLGEVVEKGHFKGYAIYGLSLEERATCPADCAVRGICYGNGMQLARRHRIGDADVFFDRLGMEIAQLADAHDGILVRLHVLGDFPSVEYVAFWADALNEYPNLACYGYTSRKPRSEGGDAIGDAIQALKDVCPERFRIRWSRNVALADGATVVERINPHERHHIACPAQSDDTACCATCAICWEPSARNRTILFLKHGPKSAEVPAAKVNAAANLSDEARYEIEERVRQLEGALRDESWIPTEWKLTATYVVMLNVLMRRNLTTREALMTALHSDDPDGGPDDKTLDVHILKMRRLLEPHGIEIENIRGQGWKLAPNGFAKLDALRRGLPPPEPLPTDDDLPSALAKPGTRPIIAIALPPNQKPAEIVEDRPTVRMVRVADMRIETDYQRDLSAASVTLIRRIVTQWDWAKFKPPICVENPDGTLIVIDGQHTAIAAASHPGLAAIPAMIVSARSIADRASAFVSHNRNRLAITAQQLFLAEVASGDASAQAIYRTICEAGASVPRLIPKKGTAKVGEIVTIKEVRALYGGLGADLLARVLRIGVAAGAAPINSTILRGLRTLLAEPYFADVAGRPDSEIAAALASFADPNGAAEAAAATMECSRFVAMAHLIRQRLMKAQEPVA